MQEEAENCTAGFGNARSDPTSSNGSFRSKSEVIPLARHVRFTLLQRTFSNVARRRGLSVIGRQGLLGYCERGNKVGGPRDGTLSIYFTRIFSKLRCGSVQKSQRKTWL